MRRQIAWTAWAWIAAAGAAWAGRKATTAIWMRLTGSDDPTNPADGDTSWVEAVGWAVVAGVIATTARVLAKRGASQAWHAVTGEAPPGA